MQNYRKFEKVSIGQWYASAPSVDGINMGDWDNLHTDLKLPKRGTQHSAGYDLFAPYTFTLEPNQEEKIPTGIRAFMNNDNVLKVYPRSGHGFKYYVRLANTVGVIDADYVLSDNEGHIFVKVRNEGAKTVTIDKGEGMCQVVFEQYFITVDDESNEIRNGGFGSTNG
jgi:dUTP pyrophosphatase